MLKKEGATVGATRKLAPRGNGRTLLAWSGMLNLISLLVAKRIPSIFRAGCLLNSKERHEARYQRRKAKRQENKRKRVENFTLERVADVGNLTLAAYDAARGVDWKHSVQTYMCNLLPNVQRAHDDILAGKNICMGFTYFDLWERGKLRHIAAVRFPERVIQKSVSQNALAPALYATVTNGCSANIKGRGTDYALKRMKNQLAAWYRKHGTDGYILQVDFSDYFASIDHGVAKGIVSNALTDQRLVKLIHSLIDSQGEVGLGLGSEPNQSIAVCLPSRIDYLGLRCKGIEQSGRYMDDSYFIALDKATLWAFLAALRLESDRLHLTTNEKKTRLLKLSHGFIFLKKRFSFGENGRIIVRPCRKSITKERRLLAKHKKLVLNGRMTLQDMRTSFVSWRGSMKRCNSYAVVQRMERRYYGIVNELKGMDYGKEDVDPS